MGMDIGQALGFLLVIQNISFWPELPITLCSFATLILPAPFPSSIAAAETAAAAAAVATVKMAANHGLPVFIVFGIDDFPRRALA